MILFTSNLLSLSSRKINIVYVEFPPKGKIAVCIEKMLALPDDENIFVFSDELLKLFFFLFFIIFFFFPLFTL